MEMSELMETKNNEKLVKYEDSCSKESDSSEREDSRETEEEGVPTVSVIGCTASEEEGVPTVSVIGCTASEEEGVPTVSVIGCIASEEEDKELLEIDKCKKEYEQLEVKTENEICDEETLKKSMMKKKNIFKIVITDETEKPDDEIDLTPKEKEYVENLILLDESDGDGGILTETKYEIITDRNFLSPPIRDETSPFFIDQSRYHHEHHVPVKLFQEYLCEGWSPAEVLYNLCDQCVWTGPELRFITIPKKAGFWYSVTVNNHKFMSYTKAKRKADAKNLATSKFLKFLGFNFSYEQWKKRIESATPWEKKYGNCNSEAITKEDMKREDFKPFEWKTTNEDSSSYEYRRSSHSESKRSSDHRSSDHRSSDHRSSDRRSSDRRSLDHRSSDHRSSDRRSSDYRSSDYRSSDHRLSDHRSSDHRSDSPERRRVTLKRKRSLDEESMRREFRRRSPESSHRKSLSSPIKRRDQRN